MILNNFKNNFFYFFFLNNKFNLAFFESFQYDAEELGGHGSGGEYEVQLGFGWSNGVIVELLDKYGNILSAPGSKKDASEMENFL